VDVAAKPAIKSGVEKQAQAMLDLGRLFLDSGLLERGKSTFEDLIVKFPDSEAAMQAKRQLAGLAGKPR
jgi:lipopolysaccharide biosynthesis regulator YciM